MVLEYGYCEECDKKYTDINRKWCKPCQINYLKRNFITWTSGNEKIDQFIQEMQLKIDSYNDIIFEWIPYNQFYNIKEIGKCGYTTVHSAIWKYGLLCYDENMSNSHEEIQDEKVTLKYLCNSQYMINKLLNEVWNYLFIKFK
jgi:hypothetical protein